MTVYFYPNEVEVVVVDGKRVAYLKPDWKEIRKKNEQDSLACSSVVEQSPDKG